MATIAEFAIPADDFPLGHIFETLPDVTIEIERVVPTNKAILPYFWARNVSVDRVRETFETQGALQSFTIVDDLGDQGLVRADWDHDVEGFSPGLLRQNSHCFPQMGHRKSGFSNSAPRIPIRLQPFNGTALTTESTLNLDVSTVSVKGMELVSTASLLISGKRYCSPIIADILISHERLALTNWLKSWELLASRSPPDCAQPEDGQYLPIMASTTCRGNSTKSRS